MTDVESCWRRFAGVVDVVRGRNTPDTARFFLRANADEERVQSSRLGFVKYRNGTGAGREHPSIGEANPLISVLIELPPSSLSVETAATPRAVEFGAHHGRIFATQGVSSR